MDERRKFMETGEMGFCPVCGTISEVVVLPDDRLQARIAKEMERVCNTCGSQDAPDDRTPDEIVRECVKRIREILETPAGRDVKEMLVAIQALLVMAAEAQGELLDERIDLMRLTMETLETVRG